MRGTVSGEAMVDGSSNNLPRCSSAFLQDSGAMSAAVGSMRTATRVFRSLVTAQRSGCLSDQR